MKINSPVLALLTIFAAAPFVVWSSIENDDGGGELIRMTVPADPLPRPCNSNNPKDAGVARIAFRAQIDGKIVAVVLPGWALGLDEEKILKTLLPPGQVIVVRVDTFTTESKADKTADTGKIPKHRFEYVRPAKPGDIFSSIVVPKGALESEGPPESEGKTPTGRILPEDWYDAPVFLADQK